TGVQVAPAAETGDSIAQLAMADLAKWLGEGLALVADVYDPEEVVIAGGGCESAPLFPGSAREHCAAAVTGAGHRRLARVRGGRGGDMAGVVGAAVLAREHALAGEPHLACSDPSAVVSVGLVGALPEPEQQPADATADQQQPQREGHAGRRAGQLRE